MKLETIVVSLPMIARLIVNFIDKNACSGSHNKDESFEMIGVVRRLDLY